MRSWTLIVAVAALAFGATAACGDSGGGSSNSNAATAKGPINIWYSNNEQEVAWGKQVVAAWNSRPPRPDGHRRSRSRPASPPRRSSARNHRRHRAVPDLQHLTGRGAAFQKQGGLMR